MSVWRLVCLAVSTVRALNVDSSIDLAAIEDLPPQLAPRCWHSSVARFWSDHGDELQLTRDDVSARSIPSILCSQLSEDMQKLLALEISRCHLVDAHKPLFESEECATQLLLTPQDVYDCLPELTDDGFTAYTHFYSYTQQLCARLLSEAILLQQHEARRDLLASYQKLQLQHEQQAKSTTNMLDDLGQQLATIPGDLQDQLTDALVEEWMTKFSTQLEEQIHTHVQGHLRVQMEALLDLQALRQAHMVQDLTILLDRHQDKYASQLEDLLQEVHDFAVAQTMLWDEHQQSQERQAENIASLVSHVSQTLSPVLNLQSWIEASSWGAEWLVHTLVAFHVGRFLTCGRATWVVLLQAGIEVLLYCSKSRVLQTQDTRVLSYVVCLVVALVGGLLGCCGRKDDDACPTAEEIRQQEVQVLARIDEAFERAERMLQTEAHRRRAAVMVEETPVAPSKMAVAVTEAIAPVVSVKNEETGTSPSTTTIPLPHVGYDACIHSVPEVSPPQTEQDSTPRCHKRSLESTEDRVSTPLVPKPKKRRCRSLSV